MVWEALPLGVFFCSLLRDFDKVFLLFVFYRASVTVLVGIRSCPSDLISSSAFTPKPELGAYEVGGALGLGSWAFPENC